MLYTTLFKCICPTLNSFVLSVKVCVIVCRFYLKANSFPYGLNALLVTYNALYGYTLMMSFKLANARTHARTHTHTHAHTHTHTHTHTCMHTTHTNMRTHAHTHTRTHTHTTHTRTRMHAHTRTHTHTHTCILFKMNAVGQHVPIPLVCVKYMNSHSS